MEAKKNLWEILQQNKLQSKNIFSLRLEHLIQVSMNSPCEFPSPRLVLQRNKGKGFVSSHLQMTHETSDHTPASLSTCSFPQHLQTRAAPAIRKPGYFLFVCPNFCCLPSESTLTPDKNKHRTFCLLPVTQTHHTPRHPSSLPWQAS